jgi:hypothetical protein
VGVSTAWRYVQEAIALLAATADDRTAAMQRIRRLAYPILDGTLIPIDRDADQRGRDDFRRQGLSRRPWQCAHPFKRRRFRPKLSRRQKAVNRAHAKIRARGERAIATPKTWKILVKSRCCPRRATAIVQAILVLHHVEADRYAG